MKFLTRSHLKELQNFYLSGIDKTKNWSAAKLSCRLFTLTFQDKSSGSCGRNQRNSRLLKKRGTVIDKDFGAICGLKKFICGIFDKRGVGKIFGIAIEIPVRVIHEIIFPDEKLCLMSVLNGLSLCLLDF